METTTASLVPSAEACELLFCDRSTLTRWVKAGRLAPALRLPGTTGAYLFNRSDVVRLAAERAASC